MSVFVFRVLKTGGRYALVFFAGWLAAAVSAVAASKGVGRHRVLERSVSQKYGIDVAKLEGLE